MKDILASESLAGILAGPTLVTLSGEKASFLTGGEVPIPRVQGTINNAFTEKITPKDPGRTSVHITLPGHKTGLDLKRLSTLKTY